LKLNIFNRAPAFKHQKNCAIVAVNIILNALFGGSTMIAKLNLIREKKKLNLHHQKT
jgi:hypothetical protein